jgi:hypothetical protein
VRRPALREKGVTIVCQSTSAVDVSKVQVEDDKSS